MVSVRVCESTYPGPRSLSSMGWAGTESVDQLLSPVAVTRRGPARVSGSRAGQRQLPPATGARRGGLSLSPLPCSAAQAREGTAWAPAEARAAARGSQACCRSYAASRLAGRKGDAQVALPHHSRRWKFVFLKMLFTIASEHNEYLKIHLLKKMCNTFLGVNRETLLKDVEGKLE